MLSYSPLSTVAGQPSAQAAPSRVNSGDTPAQSERAESTRSARATARAQVVTSPDEASIVRGELAEGQGARSRRAGLSTEEFIARRRYRTLNSRVRPSSSPTPRLRATQTFKNISEQTAFQVETQGIGELTEKARAILSRTA
ncbi:MAG: hypothetical protein CL940_04215 [Deltaproteobacteria bacterium]|nr:hypothetical protein [Deltaproteobacteria bacterium]